MMLAEPKTALAGVMHETSFARFIASMAAFNIGRALSRRFGLGAGNLPPWSKLEVVAR